MIKVLVYKLALNILSLTKLPIINVINVVSHNIFYKMTITIIIVLPHHNVPTIMFIKINIALKFVIVANLYTTNNV